MEVTYFDDIYKNIPDIYTNIDIDKPILKKIEIKLNNFYNYDIIINDNNKYNNIPIIDNVLFRFNSELFNCELLYKKKRMIYCKTNCNFLFYIDHILFQDNSPIFDEHTNTILLNDLLTIRHINNSDCIDNNKDKYLLLYFYYTGYKFIYRELFSLNNKISYATFSKIFDVDYIFCKYIVISCHSMVNIKHNYEQCDNSIIYLDIIIYNNILEDTNNKNLSLMCVVNISYDFYGFLIIIITPIKIIDKNTFYEIEIFNGECSKCSKCSKYNINNFKYYSKFPFICTEHYKNLVKKMLHLFFNYTNSRRLYISVSNIISNLNKFNIDVDINNNSNYIMTSFI